MKVGTVDIPEEPANARTRRLGRVSGSSTSPGGSGDDPGGGDDGSIPENPQRDEENVFKPGISRIFTGFLLVVVLMTFGGLIGAYIVIATNRALEWRPFELPIQVWISTAIIIASSVTYHLAQVAVCQNDHRRAKRFLIVTTILGATFISSQLLAWVDLNARGLYMSGNPYAGFFYVLTAVHAVHVIGGIVALGAILLRSWYPTAIAEEVTRRRTLSEVVGWYWHFMGALWVVLFILLGFWK